MNKTAPEDTAAGVPEPPLPVSRTAQSAALIVALALVLPPESQRFREAVASQTGAAGWLFNWNIDTTCSLIVLLLLPLAWRRRRPPRFVPLWLSEFYGRCLSDEASKRYTTPLPVIATCALLVASLSVLISRQIAETPAGGTATNLRDLPPAYHDEYSYLFQAETFLAGRLWFPGHPNPEMARLFDQVHILNEGRVASRFFPATGVWIAPFLAMGQPLWGHWIAGALATVFVFLAGRELGGLIPGFIAGMMLALSGGCGLFSNLLLAHHPALLGLSVFLFAFLRMSKSDSPLWPLAAGCGLTFAMLARPMTAAGFGLPFGLWLLWSMLRRSVSGKTVLFVGLPIAVGLGGLFVYNRAITGDGFTMPYQQYTDVYTPNHVYGFYNVTHGSLVDAPKRLENYDGWAEELTPELARKNVQNRLVAVCQWTIGLVPLAAAAVVIVLGWRRWAPGVRLIAAALVSLHTAHIPYWYDGIMHWHYVFESVLLLVLLFAAVCVALLKTWNRQRRALMPVWLAVLVGAAILPNYVAVESLWPWSRLRVEIDNIAFAGSRHRAFRELINKRVVERPAIVLIEPDPTDRHIDFVLNEPTPGASVLFARSEITTCRRDESGSLVYQRTPAPLPRLMRAFPNRTFYRFRPNVGAAVRQSVGRVERMKVTGTGPDG